MAAVLRAVLRASGAGKVEVVENLVGEELTSRSLWANLVVLEGLEPDGVLGCLTVQQLAQLGACRAEAEGGSTPARHLDVLPSALRFSVALAQVRLREATGIGVDLSAFADAYGGLAPLPQAVPGERPAAVRADALSEEVPAACLNLASVGQGTSSPSGSRALALAASRRGRPDALLVRCVAELGPATDRNSGHPLTWTFDTLHALPARLVEVQPGGMEIPIHAHWNAHRLWFEVEDASLFSSPPLPRAHIWEWYSEMMNDAPRNKAFAAGIEEAISRARAARGACHVADLGCGVGVLSALALRAGAEEVLGVEITPHLARCASRVLADAAGPPGKRGRVTVRCSDLRSVECSSEEERFDVVVSELLDAGGMGEKIVPFMRHAKAHLLRPGGEVVPRRLRVRAALFDLRLPPPAAGVDPAALEPFWLPARASAGEWLALDLDGGLEWQAVSEPVEAFDLDFHAPQAELVQALGERELRFALRELPAGGAPLRRCSAVVWWFEADVCDAGPPLSSAPSAFRPAGAAATHWAQGVAALGPWAFDLRRHRALRMRLRTDGVNLTWTPLHLEGDVPATHDGPPPCLELPDAEDPAPALREVLASWRAAGADSAVGLRALRARVDEVGDIARLRAIQAAALHIAAQPGLFGLEATSEAVAALLKHFYM